MDIDHEEQEDSVSRYTKGSHAGAEPIEDDEEEVPRNPLNAQLKFRNYVPKDKPLRKHHIRAAPEDLVSVMEDRFTAEVGIIDDEALFQEASKESNWDLKRELSDKMTVLDTATQVALAQLLKLKVSAKQ